MQIGEEGAEDESPPSGAAWCFAAVIAFMAMLLIRHMFELFNTEQAHQQDSGKPPNTVLGPEASAGMLLLWLTVRFLVILIPMYAVLRVMHTVRDQQMQSEADRDLEQELASLLWVSNVDLMALQTPCDGDMSLAKLVSSSACLAEHLAARPCWQVRLLTCITLVSFWFVWLSRQHLRDGSRKYIMINKTQHVWAWLRQRQDLLES